MNIGSVSAQSVSATVWSQTVRELTGLGSSLIPLTIFNNAVSLAANASISFRPATTVIRMMSISIRAGAAGSTFLYMSDGTTDIGCLNIPTNSFGSVFHHFANVPYPKITNNDAANPAFYSYFASDWNVQ